MERSKERGGSEEVKIKWRGVGKDEKVVGDRRQEGDYITTYLLNNILLTK